MGIADFGITDLVRLGLDVLEARLPFRIETLVSGNPVCLAVYLTNHTKDVPVYVHSLRVHVGDRRDSWAFRFAPFESVKIEPRNRALFSLSGRISEMQRYVLTKYAKDGDDGGSMTPELLTERLISADAGESWLEVDFNEFQRRRFRKGKVQWMFTNVRDRLRKRT